VQNKKLKLVGWKFYTNASISSNLLRSEKEIVEGMNVILMSCLIPKCTQESSKRKLIS
jgi:hypothetical protein